ncbi:MAG: response regulator transcription factor [Mobiluncus porci]|uniref:response regulator n=1 Tax=Mobiluncus porci TaxID=2652278 RepID=UPI0023F14117|nr:response regulator transcription factor [Mobiluncus porci]MDD7542115.1 response regulator transcription factor [Mobiluncus porci]MDY5747768.1 response regulator transcription factor [Mobiluncus porci]
MSDGENAVAREDPAGEAPAGEAPAGDPVSGEPIKVLLVDDQSLIRMGFRMVLEAADDIEVVGEAADGKTALQMVRATKPDVVLMDVRMPNMNGIEATGEIVGMNPAVKVIILTTFDLDEYAFGALRAGASGFLLKDAKPEELIAAIRAVAHGDAAISPRVTKKMLELFAPQLPGEDEGDPALTVDTVALASLTERETEVLKLIAQGLTNQEIADELYISMTTVKTHVGNILGKINARDRVQAVIFAYENGLVEG